MVSSVYATTIQCLNYIRQDFFFNERTCTHTINNNNNGDLCCAQTVKIYTTRGIQCQIIQQMKLVNTTTTTTTHERAHARSHMHAHTIT